MAGKFFTNRGVSMYDYRQFIGQWFVLEPSGRAVAMCTRKEDAEMILDALNNVEKPRQQKRSNNEQTIIP